MLTHEHRTNFIRATRSWIAGTAALTLVACGGSPPSTIVRVPVSELPGLGPSTLPKRPPTYVVTTIDGSKHTLSGRIQRVELDIAKQAVPIGLPFKARIQGDQLEVLTDQLRTYHVPDISYAAVQYSGYPPGTVSPGRRYTGIGLMVGSVLPLAIGTFILVEGSGQSGGGGLSGLIPIFGGAALIAGAGLFIAGAIVITPSSPPPQAPAQQKKTTFVRPQLRVSPTGASFAAEF